ncbi:MAG: SCO family protein [Gemmatimonadota bacterium]
MARPRRCRRWAAPSAWAWLLALALAGCGSGPLPAPALEVYPLGGDFALTDHHNQPFVLSDHRGQVFVLFFGFTSCPDVCPVILSRLATAQGLLGRGGASVTILFATVDPRRDTPARMAEYLQAFDGHIIGLTGSEEQIRRVTASYGAGFEVEGASAEGYGMGHSSRAYLIDGKGQVRYLFSETDPPETIAGAAAQLL